MELRTLADSDLEQLWQLDSQTFHRPAERRDHFMRFTDPERYEGIFEEGRLVAVAGAAPFGQYFGGCPV